ncbi:MAG: efflux RND transporter permease subunit, partial [Planctomycetes bacterium]|nr:efflux RND transporter permease subunit [Planctomycetota bacterium]
MLSRLVEFSLRRRVLVLLLAAALIVHGARVVAHAPLDVLPDFAPAQVTVQTECPGRTAEQIELQVTVPIESAVQGAVGVAVVRSESLQGLSLVQVVFGDGVDPYRARQSIAEALTEALGELPADVAPPRLTPLTSATMDLLKIGLLSDALSPQELRDLAQWTVAPHLSAVPGVANVSVFGGDERRVEVQIDPVRAAASGLTYEQIAAGVEAATALTASGYAESAAQRLVVDTGGGAADLELLRDAIVGMGVAGAPVRLLDVAEVRAAPAPKFGDCIVQGRRGVLLTTTSQYGTNTMAVTQAVEAALAELAPVLAGAEVTLLPRMHRPATFIEHALANLSQSLLLGAAFVAVVLLLFLRDLRAAAISLLAIPLSLLAAVLVLTRLGFALDTMALGGLAMALGEVVDDSIVDVENIVRRLRQNALLPQPRARLAVVLDASVEVRSAV